MKRLHLIPSIFIMCLSHLHAEDTGALVFLETTPVFHNMLMIGNKHAKEHLFQVAKKPYWKYRLTKEAFPEFLDYSKGRSTGQSELLACDFKKENPYRPELVSRYYELANRVFDHSSYQSSVVKSDYDMRLTLPGAEKFQIKASELSAIHVVSIAIEKESRWKERLGLIPKLKNTKTDFRAELKAPYILTMIIIPLKPGIIKVENKHMLRTTEHVVVNIKSGDYMYSTYGIERLPEKQLAKTIDSFDVSISLLDGVVARYCVKTKLSY